METPPELPDPKPPLGRRFIITLLTPLVLMAITFATINMGNVATFTVGITSLATLLCSTLLAIQLGRRFNEPGGTQIVMSLLMFFAIFAFYFVCFFIGCTATITIGH